MATRRAKKPWLKWRPILDEVADEVLLMFTIHAPARGRKHYVIHRWRVDGHKITPEQEKPMRAPDMVAARWYVPPNKMWCEGPLLHDDPTVLESWI